MVNYIGTERIRELVSKVGVAPFMETLAGEIDADYRRWSEFDKSARHASHSAVGVIELMPTSDGRLYSFKYVNGHPKNTAEGLLTVTAFGVLADVATGYPLLLSEMTFLTALRTAAISALAARHMARADSRVHGAHRQWRAERVSGHRVSSHAGSARIAALRYRSRRHRQTQAQSRGLVDAGSWISGSVPARPRRCAAPTSSPR